MGFISQYFGLAESTGEHQVLCPFSHTTPAGAQYVESNPSASVNTDDELFHCMSCGRGMNEVGFVCALFGTKRSDAHKIIPAFHNDEDLAMWDSDIQPEYPIPLAEQYNITEDVQRELHLGTRQGTDIDFPIFMFDKLVDVRHYAPHTTPKCRSRIGSTTGFILPYDIWINTPLDRWTLLCAGEKDMAVARSHGFNAITITGGEQTSPKFLSVFKDRLVAIVYDNDTTGLLGAKKQAKLLFKWGAKVKMITNFHEGMGHKEDITDYFNKYGHTRDELIKCIEATDWYVDEEHMVAMQLVDLHQATQPKNTGKILMSNIQVSATNDAVFTMPVEVIATKTRMSDDPKANAMPVQSTKVWALEEDNMEDVLHLIDNNFKEKALFENKKMLTGVPFTERCVKYKDLGRATVYKLSVTDMFETVESADHMPMEYTAYSINHRLESGKKYTAKYKIVPHPYAGQQLIMIIWDVTQASDSVSSFEVTDEVKSHLDIFRGLGTVEQTINHCVESVKGLLGYNGNNTLIETIDLAYHTPLSFNLGTFNDVRGYIDLLVVSESRVGKSSTADVLRSTYGLGTFASLAGNSATIAGLVGGSNKVNGSFQTKAGLIPRNHKGLLILEEFGKSKTNIVTELTDIRSSNEVRIARVSGSISLPAMVRMITLSNVKTDSSHSIRAINSYPHGIAIISELVGSAEDIARYDIMLVLGDKGTTISDPYWQPQEPLPKEAYRTRVRWVWSRSAKDVYIPDAVGKYIFKRANELNTIYDTHVKIFGTEAWKKLARLAIAVAGYCVSTDSTYTQIIVMNEHVDYAYNYFIRVYDNTTFRLKEYVTHERSFTITDSTAAQVLSDIYQESSGIIMHIEQEYRTNRTMINAAAGLSNDKVNGILNRLLRHKFIRIQGNDIIPTERFRLTLPNMDRTDIRRV